MQSGYRIVNSYAWGKKFIKYIIYTFNFESQFFPFVL
jgi:hypothetical protein